MSQDNNNNNIMDTSIPTSDDIIDHVNDHVLDLFLSTGLLENNEACLDFLSSICTSGIFGAAKIKSTEPPISHNPVVVQDEVKTETWNGLTINEKDDKILLKNNENVQERLEEWRKNGESHFTRCSFKAFEDALCSSTASSSSDMASPNQVTGSRKRRYSEVKVLDEKEIETEWKQDICDSSEIKIIKVESLQKHDTKKGRKQNTKAEDRVVETEALRKHIEKMKKIMCDLDRSSKFEIEKLHDLMDITYKLRFQDYYVDDMSIQVWIKKYPALTEYEITKEEFERVYWTTKNLKKLEIKLKKCLSSEIEKFRKNLPRFANSFAAKCLEKLDSCVVQEEQLLLDTQMACMIHNRTNGKAEGEIFINNDTGLKPRLQVTTPNFEIDHYSDGSLSYILYTEMEKVTEVKSFYEAVLVCYLFYWIFWLDYTPTANQLFSLFDSLAKK